jgi:hypothetical protein
MRSGRGLVFAFAFVAFVACAAAGCGPDAPHCDIPQNQVCPDPAPSYATDIKPIIDKYCVGCHSPGGVEANRPLIPWAELNARYGSVLQRVYFFCSMPPADAPQLTDPTERETLLGWLECMAPDN